MSHLLLFLLIKIISKLTSKTTMGKLQTPNRALTIVSQLLGAISILLLLLSELSKTPISNLYILGLLIIALTLTIINNKHKWKY